MQLWQLFTDDEWKILILRRNDTKKKNILIKNYVGNFRKKENWRKDLYFNIKSEEMRNKRLESFLKKEIQNWVFGGVDLESPEKILTFKNNQSEWRLK
jgi:hypothetical protein